MTALIDIGSDWEPALQLAASGTAGRIFVAGPTDSGKSTLCHILQKAALEGGRSAAILDLDVGQKIIGPPACVTLGATSAAGLVLTDLAFAATTDPIKAWPWLIAGAQSLARSAAVDLLVVNTCGYLNGSGAALKVAEMSVVEPDALVVLGSSPDLDVLLRHQTGCVLRLPVPRLARRKTEGERRAARRAAFRSYFADCTMLTLSERQLTTPNGAADFTPGRLVGLADQQGRDIAVGIVADPVGDRGDINLLAPPTRARVRQIKPGSLMLDRNFAERHIQHRP